MQYIDCLFKLGHVQHSIGPAFLPDPDFIDASPDRGYRLPIVRRFSLLYLEELMPCRLWHHREAPEDPLAKTPQNEPASFKSYCTVPYGSLLYPTVPYNMPYMAYAQEARRLKIGGPSL